MGFKYWWGGLIFIALFWFIIGVPCAVVAFWGSKMVNDLGNNPTKSAQIQLSVWWVYLVAFISLVCLIAYGAYLINSNFG